MQKNLYFPATLLAVAMLAGCAAPKNPALTDAHERYNSARGNPQVTTLAPLELKEAGDALNKADYALTNNESTERVNHLSYLAKQQISIAQETARRKAAEAAVANAAANRNEARLEARTAEADAAKQQAADAQSIVDQQTVALAVASANADRDQDLIAQQEKQLKDLNAKKTKRGLVVTLGDVLFGTNKAQLKSGGTHSVQKLADFLKQYPNQKVLIEGHTDSTGSDSVNLSLSERRADAVRTALLDQGISNDRIATRGYGEAYPVVSNNTAANRQMNRRVEIILSDESGNIAPR